MRANKKERAKIRLFCAKSGFPGVVYFVRVSGDKNGDTGQYAECVKIGYTELSPVRRLKQLQTGSVMDLTLVGFTPGTPDLEKQFHAIFQKARVREAGEWFYLTPLLAQLMQQVAQGTFTGIMLDRARGEVSLGPPISTAHVPKYLKEAQILFQVS